MSDHHIWNLLEPQSSNQSYELLKLELFYGDREHLLFHFVFQAI